jgi:proline iminopeptidase
MTKAMGLPYELGEVAPTTTEGLMMQLDNGARLVDLDGYRLNCVVDGSGPPLLVVHGGMGYGHAGFRPWLDPLGETSTLIYVDLPGNGASDTPVDYESWDQASQLAESLHLLRQELGLESWGVFGHSFGGLVVQQYALAHPDEIDQLMISCSASCLDHLDQSRAMAREYCSSEEPHRVLAEELFRPKASDAEFDRITGEVRSSYFADPGVLGTRAPMPQGGSAAAYNCTLRVWAHSTIVERVPELSRLRVLVLGAARDWTFPLEAGARRTHRLIAGSNLHEFERSGHFPYVEQHEEFLDVVSTWLAKGRS